jgi:hypothetical protein
MSYLGRDFYNNIAMGGYSNISSWAKIGYTPNAAITDCDVWSYGTTQPVYLFPTAAAGLEITSTDNTQDIATVIKGNAQGASAVLCDAGGTTTTLNDANVDFGAATAVVAGDILTVESAGTTPEWAYITSVATNTLTFAGGLSSGGSCATARAYSVVDYSANTGAKVMYLEYLDGSYATKHELIKLNGTAVIPTVNTDIYRIQGLRVVGTGSNLKPVGAISLRHLSNTPVYTYITAGFTRARNNAYTVPAGKTLYVTSFSLGFGIVGNTKGEFCRGWTRANVEPGTGFNTGSIFFPYTGVISGGQEVVRDFPVPTKLPAKTDIKISVQASAAGAASSALRGFLVS